MASFALDTMLAPCFAKLAGCVAGPIICKDSLDLHDARSILDVVLKQLILRYLIR